MAVEALPRPHFATIYNAGNANLNMGRHLEHLAATDKSIET